MSGSGKKVSLEHTRLHDSVPDLMNIKSRFELCTACSKWKYTPLTGSVRPITFIEALLPRCQGGTYKHRFKHAYVISCLFSSPNKKSFIFLQNQNTELQWSLRDVISARQLSWALFVFAVVVWTSRNVRWRETRVAPLVAVDRRRGIVAQVLQMSVM